MNKHPVLVYGSLRDGFHNNPLLTSHNAEYQGTTNIPGFVMHSLGGFPMIVPATKLPKDLFFPWNSYVMTELWLVNDECLSDLDSLEGHPNWYKRQEVGCPKLWRGKVNIYVGTADYVDKNSYGIVKSGDWNDYRNHPNQLVREWRGIQPSRASNLLSQTTWDIEAYANAVDNLGIRARMEDALGQMRNIPRIIPPEPWPGRALVEQEPLIQAIDPDF